MLVHQHQVGAFAFGNHSAVLQVDGASRVAGDQRDRRRQVEGVTFVARQAERGVQQAGGIVIR